LYVKNLDEKSKSYQRKTRKTANFCHLKKKLEKGCVNAYFDAENKN